MHILSEHHPDNGALLFRNRYNTAFSDRVTFFRVNEPGELSFTSDRREFIGSNRNLQDPQALHRKKLSGRVGAGMDPCAALQVPFDLAEDGEKEIVFLLGSAADTRQTDELLVATTGPEAALHALRRVKQYWEEILGAVRITTPDKALDIFANGWLLYQTLSCRVFGQKRFLPVGRRLRFPGSIAGCARPAAYPPRSGP